MSDKNGSAGRKPDVEALRREIKQTRAELGETVQALAAKADVKARAKEQVEQTKQRARAQVHGATERVREVAATAAAVATGRGRSATALQDAEALDEMQDARVRVRRRPVPFVAVVAAGVALVGIILIVRGRRK